MATTPEGKVKKDLRKVLALWGDQIYTFWPVQTGFGSATLDVIGSAAGYFFSIETKRAKKDLTDRQYVVREMMLRSKAKVFRINNDVELLVFEDWLRACLGPPPSNLER
jgi:hypothetical protein